MIKIYEPIERVMMFFVRYPLMALFLALVMLFGWSQGFSHLKMETDYRIFFDESDPMVARFDAFQQEYGREDSVYIMVDTKYHNGAFSDENIALVHEITQEIRSWPFVDRINALPNYPLVRNIDGDLQIGSGYTVNGDDVERDRPLEEIIKAFLQEEAALNRLISHDGAKTALWVSLKLPSHARQDSSEQIYRTASGYLNRLSAKYPDLEFAMTGSVALDEAFAVANQRDMMKLFPLAFVTMIVLAGVIMRSILILIVSFVSVIGAVMIALGFAGFANIPLSSVSISSPTIVMILTVAQVVHLFVAYNHVGPMTNRQERIEAAVKRIMLPSILTMLTTFIGLITLVFSPIPPFVHLGMIASFGVLLAWPLPFLIGTAALRLRNPQKASASIIQPIIEKLADLLQSCAFKRGITPAIIFCLTVSAAMGLNKLDDNYVKYFDDSFTFRTDTDKIENGLSGIYLLEYDLPAKSGDVYETRYLAALAKLTSQIIEMEGVTAVDNFVHAVTRVEAELNHDAIAHFLLPMSREDAERNAILYEMSVPGDFDLRNRISQANDSSRLTVYLANVSIERIKELDYHIQQFMVVDPYWGKTPVWATGVSILFSVLGIKNIQAMLVGTLGLFFCATLLMFAIFKEWRISLVVSLGNIMPALVTFGLWGLFVGEIGLASAAVAAVTLGIVIDDTIHIAYRYSQGLKQGLNTNAAMDMAIRGVGAALATSTIILAGGFGFLSLSGFEVNASLGIMVAITVIIAGLFDLLILPVLIVKARPYHQQNIIFNKGDITSHEKR